MQTSSGGGVGRHAGARGFSLVELAIVLAVIGVIIGMVTIGAGVYRSATHAKIHSTFVQGWQTAYDGYVQRRGSVPGSTDGTQRVNDGSGQLCNGTDDALLNTFLEAGVELPDGRGPGQQHRAVYQDSNGNPQSVEVCFANMDWSVPGEAVGVYNRRPRNVMILRNLTPSLARQLDNAIDGRADARFGRFREMGVHDNTDDTRTEWSLDDTDAMGGTSATDDDQVAVVTGVYKMSR